MITNGEKTILQNLSSQRDAIHGIAEASANNCGLAYGINNGLAGLARNVNNISIGNNNRLHDSTTTILNGITSLTVDTPTSTTTSRKSANLPFRRNSSLHCFSQPDLLLENFDENPSLNHENLTLTGGSSTLAIEGI